jgi:hypothetical protein
MVLQHETAKANFSPGSWVGITVWINGLKKLKIQLIFTGLQLLFSSSLFEHISLRFSFSIAFIRNEKLLSSC